MANNDRRDWKGDAVTHFERWAEHYDRDIIQILLFEPCFRRVLGQLRQWKRRDLPHGRILDIGCGTGTLGAWAVSVDPSIDCFTGLDMSENMISKATAKRDEMELGERLQFTVGDAEHLPFEDNSFDVVTCCNSFHHYPHQGRAVREMHRVLNDGGRLILIDGDRDNLWGFFIFEVCVARVEKSVHHCKRTRFKRLMDRAGFSRTEHRTFGVCPPALMNVGYV